MNFTREITIKPAYDCLMVQPCVHGSDKCGNVPGYGHGRHNAEMHLRLAAEHAEVILSVGTNWFLPETPLSAQLPGISKGRFIEWHSTAPQYEDHAPLGGGSSECPRQWDTCYIDQSYWSADEGWNLLVSKGTDAVWEWLEGIWRDKFGGAA